MVASKAAGVPTQHDPSGDRSLPEMLEPLFGEELWVVHRIDRPASGLVVIARTQTVAAALSELFRTGRAVRRYWAITASRPPADEGVLRHRLRTSPGANKSRVTDTGGKQAELRYRLVAQSDRYWLLDIELVTGRHHQIRAQLAAVGCPVRGDIKYGARRTIPGGGIGLHARSLSFAHPQTGEQLSLAAPAPDDPLWNALTGTPGP